LDKLVDVEGKAQNAKTPALEAEVSPSSVIVKY
jgi:hypothetical protein